VRRAVATAAVLALTVAGCGREQEPPPTQRPGTIVFDGVTANDRGSGEIAGESVSVEAGDFYFAPTVIVAPRSSAGDISRLPGRQVDLEVTAGGAGPHNVRIPEQEIDVDVAAGETVRVLMTLPETGTLVFWCKYHRDRGMAGAFVAA
jgi:plastocyanin